MRKAIIQNGKVINIIECTEAGLPGLRLPAGLTLWDCGQYPVALGDNFADGVFSRDGQPLAAEPTEAQQIAELADQLTAAQLALAELAGLVAGGGL